jgi:hypothetical protein
MQAQRKRTPLVAAIGARETGKTPWIKQQLAKARPARLLIWDPMDEYGECGTVFTDRARLVDFIGPRPTFAAVYRPGDQLALYEARFDWFCRVAWTLGNLTIVVDELADVTSPNRAPDVWKTITRKGKHEGIACFAASQRPGEIDKTFLGNCTFIHCGRLNDEAAVTTMKKILGVTSEQIVGLKDLEFIERNMVTGGTRFDRLKFPVT